MSMRLIAALGLGGALALVGCGSDSGGAAGSGGSGADGPTVTMIAWEATADCSMGVSSDFTVTVTATGSGSLTYSGSVTGCTGAIDAAVSTINCPNFAPYQGTAVVTNAAGSDTVGFDIDVCETASCTTDPDTCTR